MVNEKVDFKIVSETSSNNPTIWWQINSIKFFYFSDFVLSAYGFYGFTTWEKI